MTSPTPRTALRAPRPLPQARPRLPGIAAVLLAGLALRLLIAYVVFPGEGLGADLQAWAGWAQTLGQFGPGSFYALADFGPRLLPGYMYVLWLLQFAGNGIAGLTGADIATVMPQLVKLPAIVADILVAILLYRAARRWWSPRAGLIAAALFLFIPVTWYESALWGQIDAFGVLLLLGALLLLIEGWSEPSVAVAVVATLTKPQFAIGLVVIGAVLLRRHLIRPGSGPIPTLGPRMRAIDRRLRGWFTERQGIARLVASAFVAVIVFLLVIAPFDVVDKAPASVANVPIVGPVAGVISLVGTSADHYNVLTVNAYNLWALVGPTPLSHAIGHDYMWTYDTLQVLGPFSAATVGGVLLGLVVLGVFVTLLLRDDRRTILLAFTVLAVAFFVLPTRVHERYMFPVFATGALLAATSRWWRWWYLAVGAATAINLHAVLTLPIEGYATPGLAGLPFASAAREDVVVASVAVVLTAAFAYAGWVLLRTSTIPTIAAPRRRDATGPAPPPVAEVVPNDADAMSAAIPLADRLRALVAGLIQTDATSRGVDGAERPRRARPSLPRLPGLRGLPGLPRVSGLPGPVRSLGRVIGRIFAPVGAVFAGRLARGDGPHDRTDELANESGGRLDRRDLVVLIVLVLGSLAFRTWRLDEPAATYFDELYYPTTAEQFLQDWQYGIPADPFEWTHPHVAKYAIAGSIALLGDNRVTGFLGSISSTPLDVTFEPARPASQPATGDRVIAATGTDIRILPHGDIGSALTIPFAGASAVAFDDSDFLFVATNDGHISWIAGSDLASNDASRVAIHPLGDVGVPIRRLWSIGSGRLVAASPDGKVFLLDAGNGTILATAEMPGIVGVVRLRTDTGVRIAAATAQGVLLVNGTNLQVVQQVATSGVPTGLDFVDGSQFGWANRDLLPQPFVYVATNASKVDAIAVAPDGSLTPFTSIVMPGAVTDVKWNAATNYIHVLGTAPDAQPTVYVIDPHTNAVFADAELPFRPVAWTLDVQPNAPNLDRHRALVFSQVGSIAIVDVGGNAVATRLPGVIAGSLMAALLYLLARVLFRRRSIGVLLAIIVSLDGLLFTQSRIATNDTYLGLFIVAGVTLLAVLLRGSTSRGLERLGTAFGLPAVGVLLGLAFATKWVGLYAIGGAILILLLRSSIGRRIALLGMIALTGVFGYIAITDNPPNATFLLLMVGITALMGAAIARRGSSRDPVPGPAWVDPRRGRGLPFVWALVCLTAVPIAVYVAAYIPWALSTNGQLLPGWPPGHTGQTLADLTNQMYRYHNELRNPNGGGAPWWSWPFDLKPIWGYFWTYGDGSQALTFMAGNPVLFWLSVPAVAFGAWQAWRRRSTALAFVLIAFFALWLPWARIDRVAYQYHYYTPLPFAFLLLAYFLAELWSGPSRRTWILARVAFAAVLIAPAGLWVFRDQACAIAGAASVNATAAVCNTAFGSIALPVGLWLIAAAIAGWFVLGAGNPRRLVAVIVGVAGAAFAFLYPMVSAWPLPNGWPLIYQGLLPTWDASFSFASNNQPVASVQILSPGLVAVVALTVAVTWAAMRAVWSRRPADA